MGDNMGRKSMDLKKCAVIGDAIDMFLISIAKKHKCSLAEIMMGAELGKMSFAFRQAVNRNDGREILDDLAVKEEIQ